MLQGKSELFAYWLMLACNIGMFAIGVFRERIVCTPEQIQRDAERSHYSLQRWLVLFYMLCLTNSITDIFASQQTSLSILVSLFFAFYFLLEITTAVTLFLVNICTVIVMSFLTTSNPDVLTAVVVNALSGFVLALTMVVQFRKTFIADTEAKHKLEIANADLTHLHHEKNELMGVTAHDLRSPLSSIALAVNYAKKGLEKGDTELTSENLTFIYGVAERMKSVINNFLDLHRIESGKIVASLQNMDAVNIFAYVVKQFKPQADHKEITLYQNIVTHAPSVMVDEQLVVHVFENLISNAIKYSPYHSIVTVGVNVTPTHVQFMVKDEGEGIRPDEQSKLFKKFSKLSARPTGGEQSSGLGLAITHHYVELMSGNIWCKSEPGNGCEFYVEFPIAQPQQTTDVQLLHNNSYVVASSSATSTSSSEYRKN